MDDTKAKNRRYRNAKISEHRFRRVVECYARNMTAKAAAQATRLSEPSVEKIYSRLRERLLTSGVVRFNFAPGAEHPARFIFNRQYRGAPASQQDALAAEVITRVLFAQHFAGFERLSASDPKAIARAKRLLAYNHHQIAKGGKRRYRVFEELKGQVDANGSPLTRPFDPELLKQDGAILINELHASPADALFTWLWRALLKNPL